MVCVYRLVQVGPDPASGKYITIGAIAFDEAAGDWSARQVHTMTHACSFDSPEGIEAAVAFIADIRRRIISCGVAEPELSAAWLAELHEQRRTVVRLSPPLLVDAYGAEAALDWALFQ